ncbi:isochorismatase family protein [Akanthomyces lecanii RCEF 1005]|uniref:Isochorismatase family protein n=1 Tax=Akanthomyces lecanii RCEF 1005 TaxID=1081108 RepID=A0A168HI20_CORDF|nr:isochorismatase family protein [Akanthomyces lecanii RCEF 1005]
MAHPPSRASASAPQSASPIVVGLPPNFWLSSSSSGFDMTHPPTPTSPLVYPRLGLTTTNAAVTIAPHKTALVIIDMQNYFLSAALGRRRGEGHDAEDVLLKLGIPAAARLGSRSSG